ncbi:MAG: YchJ family metal-binding protein [Gammaproteobacteria bacterium]|nr:YchJ family metal-binding protein [Gammaproteobacteria bacterium]
MTSCPCGSQKLFSACCEPYINGTKNAQTPEILMRSRYSAYSLAKIDYIQKTMCGKAAKDYDPINAHRWASDVHWIGLAVKHTSKIKKDTGTVTFTARFSENGKENSIDEKSIFKKIKGVWFYVEGSHK